MGLPFQLATLFLLCELSREHLFNFVGLSGHSFEILFWHSRCLLQLVPKNMVFLSFFMLQKGQLKDRNFNSLAYSMSGNKIVVSQTEIMFILFLLSETSFRPLLHSNYPIFFPLGSFGNCCDAYTASVAFHCFLFLL